MAQGLPPLSSSYYRIPPGFIKKQLKSVKEDDKKHLSSKPDRATVLILQLFQGNQTIRLLVPVRQICEFDSKYLPFPKRNPSLLPTIQFSEKYNQLFQVSINEFHDLSREHFEGNKDIILNRISWKTEAITRAPELMQKRRVTPNYAASKCGIVEDKFYELETIRLTLNRIRNGSSSTVARTNCSNVAVPILDITEASTTDLSSLLKLFKPNVSDTATKTVMSDELLKFIPTVKVQVSCPVPVEGNSVCAGCSVISSCSWCGRECCQHNPLQICSYPRTGSVSSTLCSECVGHNNREDANDWAEASLDYLAQPNDESIIASLGCAFIALALGFNSQKLLRRMARSLHDQGINRVAYSLINLTMSLVRLGKKDRGEETKLYFLASSILRDLIKKQKLPMTDKFNLALASMEAFDLALKDSNNIEMPYSKAKKEEIERFCIIQFKTSLKGAYNVIFEDHKVVDIFSDELTLFVLRKTIKDFHPLFVLSNSFMAVSNPDMSKLIDNSFLLSDEELTPPFKINCPLVVLSDLKAFEETVIRLFNGKQWSSMQVAGAYIDQAHACRKSAEKAVCYLLAAMWMTRNFNSDSKYPSDVLYAYKSVIMQLLLLSCETVLYHSCNPGMELYIIRMAIGIIRKITLVPDSQLVFTEEDVFFLQKLFQRLNKVSHMCPVWNRYLPPLSLSEVAYFDSILRNVHSTFLFELQSSNSPHKQLKCHDIAYQLYQNDIHGLLPLKNSSDCRGRAMDELLKSQGLSWNDVRQAMSTPLCPRDEEGWLIQSPDLGMPQEYSKIVGFVFDASKDEPLLKLLVVKADPKSGRKGLFSQEDITTMLQLDLDDEALYFSLDQPSSDLDKGRHPFQQWRNSDKIAGTEVLNTMFITDYLMKSFVSNTDISSMPPFKQRPCKHGLTKNLPPELQEAIRPIEERRDNRQSYKYRLWIESKEVKYSKKAETELKYVYRFDEVDMEVKCQSTPFGVDATLIGQGSPDSPHVSFTRDMTKHYSELGKYFPMFTRLQELSKLQFFSFELQSLVKDIVKRCPEKAASLSRFIQGYKQPQPQSSSSGKPTWVPAVTSPDFLSIHYGGVQLYNKGNEVPTQTMSYNSLRLAVGRSPDIITGINGEGILQKSYKSPVKILNKRVFQSLSDVIQPGSGGNREYKAEFRGIYMAEYSDGKVEIGLSNDVLGHMRTEFNKQGIHKPAHFGAVELRRDIPTEHHTDYFAKCVTKEFGDKILLKDCSTSSKLTAFNPVMGVRFNEEGILCQSEEIQQYEDSSVTKVLVLSKPVTAHAIKIEDVNYSPPFGKAEKQARRSDTDRFQNWNETKTANKSKDIFDMDDIFRFLTDNASTKQHAAIPTFRENNSTELNKHLDRLFYIVFSLESAPTNN